jgi:hypothetical protein
MWLALLAWVYSAARALLFMREAIAGLLATQSYNRKMRQIVSSLWSQIH